MSSNQPPILYDGEPADQSYTMMSGQTIDEITAREARLLKHAEEVQAKAQRRLREFEAQAERRRRRRVLFMPWLRKRDAQGRDRTVAK